MNEVDRKEGGQETLTDAILCGRCRSALRIPASPDAEYADIWDAAFTLVCSNTDCGQTVYIEFPSKYAVQYGRAENLTPIVETFSQWK